MVTLTENEAKLFLSLLSGDEPNITWVMEGGDPLGLFLERHGLDLGGFGELLNKLSVGEE